MRVRFLSRVRYATSPKSGELIDKCSDLSTIRSTVLAQPIASLHDNGKAVNTTQQLTYDSRLSGVEKDLLSSFFAIFARVGLLPLCLYFDSKT